MIKSTELQAKADKKIEEEQIAIDSAWMYIENEYRTKLIKQCSVGKEPRLKNCLGILISLGALLTILFLRIFQRILPKHFLSWESFEYITKKGLWLYVALGVVTSFIVGFVITVLILQFEKYRHGKKVRKRKVEIYLLEDELEEKKKRFYIEFENTKKTVLQEKKDTEKSFIEKVNEIVPIIAKANATEELVELIGEHFLDEIKEAKRTSTIENILVECNYVVHSDMVRCYDIKYVFEKNRYKPLPDGASVCALASAIYKGVIHKLKSEYEKDESGTDYEIVEEIDFGIESKTTSVKLTYVAPNGNYVSPTGW